MTATDNKAGDETGGLREAMVQALQQSGDIRSETVAQAVRAVPRHLFAPEFSRQETYHPDKALVTKRDSRGSATSSLSATHMQVTMLEQAGIEPGMSVLEVGSGGYNAALLCELVGEHGRVVSLDIDPDVTARARSCLATAGYADRVEVVDGDAEHGYAAAAPFDRVLVTAGAGDVPRSWRQQLATGGRIVVPLRLRGMTRSVLLEVAEDRLVSTDYRMAGFVPMQGESAREQPRVPLDDSGVALWIDEEVTLDAAGLQQALQGPRVQRWPGIEFDDPPNTHLWLATAPPVVGVLTADKAATESGLVAPSAGVGVPALIRDASFAYRTKRPIENQPGRFEHGVLAHGPHANDVADEYVELLRTFDRDLRGGPGAQITVCDAPTPTRDLPAGRVIERWHTRVVVSWPEAHQL